MKKIISVPRPGDSRFKKWTKILNRTDRSKTNGYAFEGVFINGSKAELAVDTIIMCYGAYGSRKYQEPFVRLYRIVDDQEKGNLELIYKKDKLSGQTWALDVRDEIAAIVNVSTPNPLNEFSDDELLAEVKRRGLI